MQKSSFFNAILDQEGSPDRSYLAEDFARYFSSFIGNGVFPNPATNLQVIAIDDDMTVRVKSGKAWINGYFYENTDDYILELESADGVLSRIDRIVLRLDFIDREIRVYVKQGEFASNAIAKELQRDADAYEIALADIKVNAGAIKITQANITDTRLNKELCGIVHGTVDQVDTTAIFKQFESWYEQTKSAYDADMATWTTEKKQAFDDWYETNTTAFIEQFESWYNNNTTQWTNDFNTWFETIKEQLDGDLGAKLSSQILELEQTKANKTELDAVNQDLVSHKAEKASLTKLGHVKAETDEDGKLILDIPKSNYNADRIPSVNDDATQGYSVGSMWQFNEPAGTARIYVCSKDTINSAEWILYASSDGVYTPYYGGGIEYIPFEQGVHKFLSTMNSWTEKREDGLYIFSEDIGETSVYIHQIGFSSSEQINVSTIHTVNVEIESNSGGKSGIQFGVSDDKYTADSYISSVSERNSLQNVDTKIYSADVSTLDGDYYIKLAMRPETSGKDYQWKIKRIWGEK